MRSPIFGEQFHALRGNQPIPSKRVLFSGGMSGAAPDRLLLRLRRRAALVLWTETLCHAAMPAAGILAAWLVAVIFGLGSFLLLAAAIILALAALGWEIFRITPPRKPKSTAGSRRPQA